jgi:hypothetical protein
VFIAPDDSAAVGRTIPREFSGAWIAGAVLADERVGLRDSERDTGERGTAPNDLRTLRNSSPGMW